MQNYKDRFKSWDDVKNEFCIEMQEPDQVYFARYEYEDYSGTSIVVYRNAGEFFLVEAYHCSCYGLEDKWEPEVYGTKEDLIKCLEKGHQCYKDEAIQALRSKP